MCTNQKWIYKTGKYKTDNYRGQAGQRYELGTMSKCGCCAQCIAEKSNNWLVRNYFEQLRHGEECCFITLTYRDNPIIIVKKDVQDFIKRFRRKLEYMGDKRKIRYFGACEYGEKNGRPHAHLIIYGWKDNNAKYLDINNKHNIILKSQLIEEVWGLGRTSYQEYNKNEVPYIALYNTPAETFKKAYKLNAAKLKKLEEYARYKKNMAKKQRRNLINELQTLRKQVEESKKKYVMVKESNLWSLSVGWQEFEKDYIKANEYVFETYITDGTYATPSPWVKKLANQGCIDAAQEMFRREALQEKITNEEKANIIAKIKEKDKIKRNMEEWQDQKTKIEDL